MIHGGHRRHYTAAKSRVLNTTTQPDRTVLRCGAVATGPVATDQTPNRTEPFCSVGRVRRTRPRVCRSLVIITLGCAIQNFSMLPGSEKYYRILAGTKARQTARMRWANLSSSTFETDYGRQHADSDAAATKTTSVLR
jgi:hypothetical protein